MTGKKRFSAGFALFMAAMLIMLALGVVLIIHGVTWRPPAPTLPGVTFIRDSTPYV